MTGMEGGRVALPLGGWLILLPHGEIIFLFCRRQGAQYVLLYPRLGTLRPFLTSRDLPPLTVMRERAKRKSARQSVTNFQNFRITQSFASGR